MASKEPFLRLGVTIRFEDPEVEEPDAQEGIKPFEEVDIANDFMFRAVCTRNIMLCVRLAVLLLEFDPSIAQLGASRIELGSNAQLKSDPGARTSELDVYLKSEKGPVIDMEMQRYRQKEFSRRLRTYLSSADRDAWRPGEKLADIRDVIGVAVCTFDPVGLGYVRYIGKMHYVGTDKYADDGRLVVLYNAKAANKVQCEKEGISHDLMCFLRYVAGHRDEEVMGNEFVRDVDKQVDKCRKDASLRRQYMDYYGDMQHYIEVGEAKGEAKNRSKTLAAVVQAFAAGDLTEDGLRRRFGFTEDEWRSAMAAAQQA